MYGFSRDIAQACCYGDWNAVSYKLGEATTVTAIAGLSGGLGKKVASPIAPKGLNLNFGTKQLATPNGLIAGTPSLALSVSSASVASAGKTIGWGLVSQNSMYFNSLNNNGSSNSNIGKNTSSGSSKTSQGVLSDRGNGATDSKYINEIKTVEIDGMEITTGPYRKMQKAGLKDAHHIYQDAAARELKGYSRYDALTVQIQGPANKVGTPHYIATQVQGAGGSGTLGIERNIAYKSLRKSGFSVEQSKYLVREADKYFNDLGHNLNSATRVPGNRK